MITEDSVINTLSKYDKVMIVFKNQEKFEGYVNSISKNYVMIHEYVSDTYRTINRNQIVEIRKIKCPLKLLIKQAEDLRKPIKREKMKLRSLHLLWGSLASEIFFSKKSKKINCIFHNNNDSTKQIR